MKVSKTEKVKRMLNEGKFKDALSIVAGFRLGFTSKEKRIIEIANDCIHGHGSFYRQLGINDVEYVSMAAEIMNKRYL